MRLSNTNNTGTNGPNQIDKADTHTLNPQRKRKISEKTGNG